MGISASDSERARFAGRTGTGRVASRSLFRRRDIVFSAAACLLWSYGDSADSLKRSSWWFTNWADLNNAMSRPRFNTSSEEDDEKPDPEEDDDDENDAVLLVTRRGPGSRKRPSTDD